MTPRRNDDRVAGETRFFVARQDGPAPGTLAGCGGRGAAGGGAGRGRGCCEAGGGGGISSSVTATIGVGPTRWGGGEPGHRHRLRGQRGSYAVSVIDGATNTVTAAIGVGTHPEGMAVDPVTDTVYVANGGDGTVSVIDEVTGTVTATIGVGPTRPDGRRWTRPPALSTWPTATTTPCR